MRVEPGGPAVRVRERSSPFFRPRTSPGHPLAARIWAAYQSLDQTQWLDPEDLQGRQLEQLRTLLTHCIGTVPYYRELLGDRGMASADVHTLADLRRLPILARRTYQEQFERFRATTLPPGTVEIGRASTSGTTGVAVEILQTNLTGLWWWAFYLRDLEWCSIDPRGTLASIRPTGQSGRRLRELLDGVRQPHWDAGLHRVIQTGTSHVMDIHQDPRRQLAWLRRIEPNYLLSFTSSLEILAGLVLEEGRPLRKLAAVQSYGEPLTDALHDRMRAAFGVPVWNNYSCTEAGYVASACPAGHGLHVHAENAIVEILAGDDQPCKPGETGRVVLTPLHNFLSPLIRYDIMDDAEVGAERCPCGRGLPTIRSVLGKARPLLRLPDGRMKSTSATAIGLRAIGGSHQAQVIQRRPDHLIVRIVPDRAWTDAHAARVVALLQEQLEAPVHVEVLTVDRLDLPTGGKAPAFVIEPGAIQGTADPH